MISLVRAFDRSRLQKRIRGSEKLMCNRRFVDVVEARTRPPTENRSLDWFFALTSLCRGL